MTDPPKPCARCGATPRKPYDRWCGTCRNAYQSEYRKRNPRKPWRQRKAENERLRELRRKGADEMGMVP